MVHLNNKLYREYYERTRFLYMVIDLRKFSSRSISN